MENIPHYHILAVDDDPQILTSYEEIFALERYDELQQAIDLISLPDASASNASRDTALEDNGCHYSLTTATQGEEAVALMREALEADTPFALALIDMRMPPGIDGLETAIRLQQLDPSIYIVIITAYSDHDFSELHDNLDHKLLFISKPYNRDELRYLAYSCCTSWARDAELQQTLQQQNRLLQQQEQLFSLYRSTSHSIKNSLGYLNGMVELIELQSRNGNDPEMLFDMLNPQRMQMMREQLGMISNMIYLALDNSSRNAAMVTLLPLKKQLEKQLKLFAITKKGRSKKIDVQLDEIAESCVRISAVDLQTVIQNLLNNAADAVDEYVVERIRNSPSEALDDLLHLQDEVMIEIEGHIDQEQIILNFHNRSQPLPGGREAQLFEKGYTTKDDGNGIGLHDVRELLRAANGEITCKAADNNITFTLTLPRQICDGVTFTPSQRPETTESE